MFGWRKTLFSAWRRINSPELNLACLATTAISSLIIKHIWIAAILFFKHIYYSGINVWNLLLVSFWNHFIQINAFVNIAICPHMTRICFAWPTYNFRPFMFRWDMAIEAALYRACFYRWLGPYKIYKIFFLILSYLKFSPLTIKHWYFRLRISRPSFFCCYATKMFSHHRKWKEKVWAKVAQDFIKTI